MVEPQHGIADCGLVRMPSARCRAGFGAGTRAGSDPVAAGCDGADGIDGTATAEGAEAGYGIADIESIGAMHRNKPFIKACPAALTDHATERTINRTQDTLTPSSWAVRPRG